MDRNAMCPRSIRYLLAVAEYQGFTRAAEALHVSQPTLSQQIKQLEEILDVQLLDRSNRKVRLTDAGETYALYARRAISELNAGQRAIHELMDLSRGSLHIGMTPITEYLAAPLLDKFNTLFPAITFVMNEMPQDEIEAAVAEDRIDIGIAFTNTLASESRSHEVELRVLFIESLNLAVGDSHPYACRDTPLTTYEFEQESLALLNPDFALRRHVDRYCHKFGISPQIAMESNSLSVIVELVRMGRLTTILPRTMTSAETGIHPVMLEPELPQHSITLICRKGAYRCPACLAFMQAAEQWRVDHRKGVSSDKLPRTFSNDSDGEQLGYG